MPTGRITVGTSDTPPGLQGPVDTGGPTGTQLQEQVFAPWDEFRHALGVSVPRSVNRALAAGRRFANTVK